MEPVPVILQSLAVISVGLLYGAARGTATILAHLKIGLTGVGDEAAGLRTATLDTLTTMNRARRRRLDSGLPGGQPAPGSSAQTGVSSRHSTMYPPCEAPFWLNSIQSLSSSRWLFEALWRRGGRVWEASARFAASLAVMIQSVPIDSL
ncbi:MAG TPA: hypothetical protein ENK18_19020 [Deltaproteobacteria bacterium]|nr:hypothetical protein [Deltaproteobacteria bacterium]